MKNSGLPRNGERTITTRDEHHSEKSAWKDEAQGNVLEHAAAGTNVSGLRAALGSYATGVCIVTTTTEEGAPIGLTVNSFNSVSLEPPLVLFSLALRAMSLPVFQQAEHFAINLLSREQAALSQRFAKPLADRWAGVTYRTGRDSGCPLLPGSLAVFECTRHAVHEGGDHIIIVGEVRRLHWAGNAEPLIYLHGQYGHFQPDSD
ncbi:flavin reductase family protein [Fodinicurvata sediminis]|uniref:flavin reductase family protein n=1 Tax=Fodinicurvata sediminis TaxID=1121832 RepID=UPI0003B691BE|nr:flavin reductase family protein [Fodinicurvata sediminis]